MDAAPEQTTEATITIDVKVDEHREARITLTSRPMVPALNIAELLEKIAAEIRAGRLDSLRIRDIGNVEQVPTVGGDEGEIIAPGFRLYSPDSKLGAIGGSWVITGTLPREGAWRMFNHYDLQGKLVAEGLLRPEHCDSELGMFCVYPPDETTARLIGAWLDERLRETYG